MGFFSRIREGMNEEFVIGERNNRRYREDPDSLDEILTEQHARGLGSARGLREFARAQHAAQDGTLIAYRPSAESAQQRLQTYRRDRVGVLDRLGKATMVAGLVLLAASLWHDSSHD